MLHLVRVVTHIIILQIYDTMVKGFGIPLVLLFFYSLFTSIFHVADIMWLLKTLVDLFIFHFIIFSHFYIFFYFLVHHSPLFLYSSRVSVRYSAENCFIFSAMITLSYSSINFCSCNSDRVWFRSLALDFIIFVACWGDLLYARATSHSFRFSKAVWSSGSSLLSSGLWMSSKLVTELTSKMAQLVPHAKIRHWCSVTKWKAECTSTQTHNSSTNPNKIKEV